MNETKAMLSLYMKITGFALSGFEIQGCTSTILKFRKKPYIMCL